MTLVGYARFYDSIYQMLPADKPDDATIEDDEALDRWYQNYSREQAIRSGKKNVHTDHSAVPQFHGKRQG